MSDVWNVAEGAINGLEKKTIGGVSRESAEKGICDVRNTATAEINQLNETVASQSARISTLDFRYKDAQEALAKAEADSKYKQQQMEAEIAEVKAKLKESKETKTGKPKILPNGNTETIRVNKNGTVEVLEKNPEGKKVSVKFKTIDGDKMKYYFDPVTEDVIKVFKSIGGKDELAVKKNGKWTTSEVNAKKEKPEKPQLVNSELVSEDKNKGTAVYRKSYSDGSYEMVFQNIHLGRTDKIEKFNNKDKRTSKESYHYDDNNRNELVSIDIDKFNPEDGSLVQNVYKDYESELIKTIDYIGTSSNSYNQTPIKETITQKGYTKIVKYEQDEFGNVKGGSYPFASTTTIIYPKDSKIKKSTIEFSNSFAPKKETLSLRDGRTFSFNVNGDYVPYNLTIQEPGNDDVVTTDHKEVRDSLGEIGYMFNYSEKRNSLRELEYYSNVI